MSWSLYLSPWTWCCFPWRRNQHKVKHLKLLRNKTTSSWNSVHQGKVYTRTALSSEFMTCKEDCQKQHFLFKMAIIWHINCINTGCNGPTRATSFETRSLWLYQFNHWNCSKPEHPRLKPVYVNLLVKISNFSCLEAKKAYLREISLLLLVEFVLLTSRWKYNYRMPSDLLIQISPLKRNVINMQYETS